MIKEGCENVSALLILLIFYINTPVYVIVHMGYFFIPVFTKPRVFAAKKQIFRFILP